MRHPSPGDRNPRLVDFCRAFGAVTPPGAMLVAVLLAAGRPLPSRVVRAAVLAALPDADPREWGRDLNHARASGILAEDPEADTWCAGARIGAITMPPDGPHMAAAREALGEVSWMLGGDGENSARR